MHCTKRGYVMKNKSLALISLSALFVLALASSCAVGAYHDRYGTQVAVGPDWWGTVTYVDPNYGWYDLDYVDSGRHYSRRVYYDQRNTNWDGVRYNEIRPGDQVWVSGRQNHGRWNAEHIRRH
jgi:hypothetical protein